MSALYVFHVMGRFAFALRGRVLVLVQVVQVVEIELGQEPLLLVLQFVPEVLREFVLNS